MVTLSLDIRQRILDCYDEGKHTREAVAKRFRVSVGMVKKLLQQRRNIGEVGPLHWRAGRKPTVTRRHRERMMEVIRARPDATLAELREALGLGCSLTAVHNALSGMGMTYKKRRSGRASRTART
jgi:transposase